MTRRRRLALVEVRERERRGLHLDWFERAATASQLVIFDRADVSVDEIYFTQSVYPVLGYEVFTLTPSFRSLLAAANPHESPRFEHAVYGTRYETGAVQEEVRMRCADGRYKK